jgi:hypothetical protein
MGPCDPITKSGSTRYRDACRAYSMLDAGAMSMAPASSARFSSDGVPRTISTSGMPLVSASA